MKNLHEYVSLVIPRALVERTLAALEILDTTGLLGPLEELRIDLEQSLDRDLHQESILRIQHVLGDLGAGDLLPAIADAVERHPTTVADQIGAVRETIRRADERLLVLIGDDLGLDQPGPGENIEAYRNRVLARVGG